MSSARANCLARKVSFCSSQKGKTVTRFTVTQMKSILILLLLCLLFPPTSHAYLDPGTGSYGFQMLLAVGLVVVFTLKVYWKKLRSFFAKAPRRPGEGDGGNESPDHS